MYVKAARRILCVALLAACAACDLGGLEEAEGSGTPAAGRAHAHATTLPATQKPTYRGKGMAAGLPYVEVVYGAARNARLPMVVSLHGMGDHPRKPFDEFAPAARFILPRALDPYGDGYAWMPFQFGNGSDPHGAMARSVLRATRKVAAVVAELRQRRPTRGKPVVTGVSQGGMLAFAMAFYAPEHVRMAVPLAGGLPRPLWPDRRPEPSWPRIVALHGDADDTVPIEPAARLVRHLRGLGYRASLRRFAGVGHGLSEAMHRARYRAVAGALWNPTDAPGLSP